MLHAFMIFLLTYYAFPWLSYVHRAEPLATNSMRVPTTMLQQPAWLMFRKY